MSGAPPCAGPAMLPAPRKEIELSEPRRARLSCVGYIRRSRGQPGYRGQLAGATSRKARPTVFWRFRTSKGRFSLAENEHAGIKLPGQPMEEAAAEVASHAGKSLVRGFANLIHAEFSGRISSKTAKAEAAKLAIETEAQIARDQALSTARRSAELGEIEHQALLQRRVTRLRRELEIEQTNLESIQLQAIEFAEQDPDRDLARDLDSDWLFRATDLAQKISDKEVQQLWARALSSAAVANGMQLPAPALQTLGQFDRAAATDFRKFVMMQQRLGFFPVYEHRPPLQQTEPQNIDLNSLVDLGVIMHQTTQNAFAAVDFSVMASTSNLGLKLFHDMYVLTKRGADIANAVFRGNG